MFNRTKKGQVSIGLIAGLIFGIASLIVGVIIAFIVVSTLTGANLLQGARTSTSVVNESGWINATSYTLTGAGTARFLPGSISISKVVNTTDGVVISSGNYTVSTSGVITNLSDWRGVKFTYTYTTKTTEEVSANDMSLNLTKGVDNVSGKIPTVLLIAAIVLILGVLVLLVGAWQRMKVGSGGI